MNINDLLTSAHCIYETCVADHYRHHSTIHPDRVKLYWIMLEYSEWDIEDLGAFRRALQRSVAAYGQHAWELDSDHHRICCEFLKDLKTLWELYEHQRV